MAGLGQFRLQRVSARDIKDKALRRRRQEENARWRTTRRLSLSLSLSLSVRISTAPSSWGACACVYPVSSRSENGVDNLAGLGN